MRRTFRKRRFRVVERRMKDAFGQCAYDERVIALHPGLKDRKRLATLVHESLHACLPDLSEDAVAETEEGIVAWLWQDGWRPT